MENASKALIMAASVLLGVMIISVGVALFNSFSSFSRSTVEKTEEKKISEWNNNFLKYYGTVIIGERSNGTYITEPIRVTAHDIVSLANFAKQSNEDYQLTKDSSGNENTYYVQIVVNNGSKTYYNFEALDDDEKEEFLKENSLVTLKLEDEKIEKETKYYKCIKEPTVSPVTKRVMKIEFILYDK